MAEGVDVDIVDGIAELTFHDAQIKGEALAKLIELGGPHAVAVDTGGTKRSYKVSEELAAKAGLIDKPKRSGGRK